MRIRPPFLQLLAPRGSMMAFSLFITLIAALAISAAASLMSARATQSILLEDVAKRRISLANSRSLHQQFMLERVFKPDADIEVLNSTAIFNGDWGGASLTTDVTDLNVFASTSLPSSLSTVFPYNYAGFRPSATYLNTLATQRPALLSGIVDAFTSYAFVKTYTPGLAGDPFVVYRRPDDAAATDRQIELGNTLNNKNIKVNGRLLIHDPYSFFPNDGSVSHMQLKVNAKALHIDTYDKNRLIFCKSLSGSDMPPSNLPAVKTTTGALPEGSTTAHLFKGALNVINNSANPYNSLWHFMDREKTAGTGDYDTINSGTATGLPSDPWRIEDQANPQYPPPAWPSGYPPVWKVLYINVDHASLKHLRIYGVVNQIVLVGQNGVGPYNAAATLPPILITVVPNGAAGPNFQDLRMVNDNNRRIVFAVNDWNGAALDMYWEGASSSPTLIKWRMMLINEFRSITANLPSSVTKNVLITGGVMTNFSILRRTNNSLVDLGGVDRLQFSCDYNPDPAGAAGSKFTSLLPREAWIENYFLPSP